MESRLPNTTGLPAGISCSGFCVDCQEDHVLGEGNAHALAQEVMTAFETSGRLDYLTPESEANPKLSFDYLLGSDRGHMFGVLECRSTAGEKVVLRAFSSLYEGIRHIPGWVPPVLGFETYQTLVLPGEQHIKELSRQLLKLAPGSGEHGVKLQERKRASQELMGAMHDLYRLHNFKGEARLLKDIFPKTHALPGGVGECCAPKLLNYAARHDLKPLGLSEFYWGKNSKGRRKGLFYPPCDTKCRPILGYLLCGSKQ